MLLSRNIRMDHFKSIFRFLADCKQPDTPLFGNMSTSGTVKHGNTVNISCESGFTPSPGEVTLKCSNGSWENGRREWNKSHMICNGEDYQVVKCTSLSVVTKYLTRQDYTYLNTWNHYRWGWVSPNRQSFAAIIILSYYPFKVRISWVLEGMKNILAWKL